MTGSEFLLGLIRDSIVRPSEAAKRIVAMDLPASVLWPGVALVAILNTILSSLSNMLVPVPDPLDALMANPFIFAVIVAVGLVVTLYALFWIGRAFGGTGSLTDMLALLVWLQALRVAGQVVLILLLLTLPPLAGIFVLAVGILTLWIFIHFVSVGLGLHSIGRAIMVMIAAATALVLGLSMLLSLVGVNTGGFS